MCVLYDMKNAPMMSCAWFSVLAVLALVPPTRAADEKASFDGEWRTSFGIVTLKQTGNAVNGTYGDGGKFTLKGTVKGKKLTFDYQEAQATGDGNWTLDDAGLAFGG